MNKKNFFLIGGIISLIIFIDSLFYYDPKTFFGILINVWVFRTFWFLNTFIVFNAYRKNYTD